MTDVLAIVGTVLSVIGIGLALLALHLQRRHRQQDDAREVVQWAKEAGRLAADLGSAWRRNLSGGGRPDPALDEQWAETERRLRLDGPLLIARLKDDLRVKVEDHAHDLTVAVGALLSRNYISHLQRGEYRGEHPFEFLEEGRDWKELGRWLDSTTDAIIEPLQEFGRR